MGVFNVCSSKYTLDNPSDTLNSIFVYLSGTFNTFVTFIPPLIPFDLSGNFKLSLNSQTIIEEAYNNNCRHDSPPTVANDSFNRIVTKTVIQDPLMTTLNMNMFYFFYTQGQSISICDILKKKPSGTSFYDYIKKTFTQGKDCLTQNNKIKFDNYCKDYIKNCPSTVQVQVPVQVQAPVQAPQPMPSKQTTESQPEPVSQSTTTTSSSSQPKIKLSLDEMQQSVQANADYCNKYFSDPEYIFTEAKKYRYMFDPNIIDSNNKYSLYEYAHEDIPTWILNSNTFKQLQTDTLEYSNSIDKDKNQLLDNINFVKAAPGDFIDKTGNLEAQMKIYKKSNEATAFLKKTGRSFYKILNRIDTTCKTQFNSKFIYDDECKDIMMKSLVDYK